MSDHAPAPVPEVTTTSAPASADAPAPAVPPVPASTPRNLWWEVAAVLAVGVAPHLMSAVSYLCHTPTPPPYWLDALSLSVTSACTLVVMLHLIGRTGEPWAKFGIVRPRADDLMTGALFFTIAVALWWVMPEFLWSVGAVTRTPGPQASGTVDHILLVTKYVLSASAEEVVVRAYLVTRLAELLRSRGEAVIVSACLFASYHAYQGLPGFVYALAFGLVCGVAFLVLGRIWPLALGHLLYDIWVEAFYS